MVGDGEREEGQGAQDADGAPLELLAFDAAGPQVSHDDAEPGDQAEQHDARREHQEGLAGGTLRFEAVQLLRRDRHHDAARDDEDRAGDQRDLQDPTAPRRRAAGREPDVDQTLHGDRQETEAGGGQAAPDEEAVGAAARRLIRRQHRRDLHDDQDGGAGEQPAERQVRPPVDEHGPGDAVGHHRGEGLQPSLVVGPPVPLGQPGEQEDDADDDDGQGRRGASGGGGAGFAGGVDAMSIAPRRPVRQWPAFPWDREFLPAGRERQPWAGVRPCPHARWTSTTIEEMS
ncbi:hypothetical protein [Dactylosporangium cerinum]